MLSPPANAKRTPPRIIQHASPLIYCGNKCRGRRQRLKPQINRSRRINSRIAQGQPHTAASRARPSTARTPALCRQDPPVWNHGPVRIPVSAERSYWHCASACRLRVCRVRRPCCRWLAGQWRAVRSGVRSVGPSGWLPPGAPVCHALAVLLLLHAVPGLGCRGLVLPCGRPCVACASVPASGSSSDVRPLASAGMRTSPSCWRRSATSAPATRTTRCWTTSGAAAWTVCTS